MAIHHSSPLQPFGMEGFNISFGIGAFPIGLFAGVSLYMDIV